MRTALALGLAYAIWAWRTRPAPGRRIVVWDDGCGFCRRCIVVLRRLDARGTFDTIGSSDPRAYAGTGVTPEAAMEAVQLVEPDGTALAGYEAVRRAIGVLPGGFLLAPLLGLPGMRDLGDAGYRAVAARRVCITPAATVEE